MLPRIQLPADFRWWRLVAIAAAVGLTLLGVKAFAAGFSGAGAAGIIAAGYSVLGFGCFIAAAICVAPSTAGVVFSPLLRLFGDLFYPTETITRPPEDLLRSLRSQLRDRYWESVEQQTSGLIRAYGPSAELYHLRAHLAGGRDGDYKIVTSEAVSELSGGEFDRYTALLRRDPPPLVEQVGIEA